MKQSSAVINLYYEDDSLWNGSTVNKITIICPVYALYFLCKDANVVYCHYHRYFQLKGPIVHTWLLFICIKRFSGKLVSLLTSLAEFA